MIWLVVGTIVTIAMLALAQQWGLISSERIMGLVAIIVVALLAVLLWPITIIVTLCLVGRENVKRVRRSSDDHTEDL